MSEIPSGFLLLKKLDMVFGAFAPVYGREEEGGMLALGFRVGPHHCNPRGNCHGGTWATMADVVMGINMGIVSGMSGPTVNLSIDFLGSAVAGDWVEGRARIISATPKLGFADCMFAVDGRPALRASAVFRRKFPPYLSFASLLAENEGISG